MNFISWAIIIVFCIWVGVVIVGFVVTRLIGSEGRVRAQELRRERLTQWEREYPR